LNDKGIANGLKPCSEIHLSGYGLLAIGKYKDLVEQLVQRRRDLGLSQDDINSAAGFADGHLNKLEALHRIAQFKTMLIWTATLGLEITLEPANLRILSERQ